ncbi:MULTISPECIES: DUF523 domain-containing protein [Bacillus amyloliquefaciens group]|uniref:DUF523 domain-containing protein n=1 Tax=Bacillus amyloliquefaciens group TaxID=1938374 RepID=UPI0009568AB7|nr:MULTISPECIES: DUF523 domain-containing protein [Bacillus amyloliquefaciens group]MBW7975155.1 DUF523 domain-containing protein [Bacillus velezensis]MCR4364738.1 DUF523 domain-containing protein [Bacillus amyloliquefaciens]MCV3201939.1 DUF523 domain-containing protein [Bacillus velezensis]MDP1504199.1 DUF523 domain-containing protein [Bacillus velezensis]MDP1508058.1 DUF523 domain-containing protein [Bacillus velezensis]
MILVSSCLGGIECRYNGSHAASEKIRRLVEEKKAVMVCPELLGGFTTPREPAEIIGGTGEDVLNGTARIVTASGEDVTALYMDGAEKTLAYAKEIGAATVILKENSPSCGSSFIYDGTFSGKKIIGDGITSALLKRAGCRVLSVDELDQL